MAKKAKKPTKTDETEAKPSDVIKVPSTSVLKRLMASKRALTKDMAEMRGTYASEVKTAVDDHHLHKGAFGWITQLDKKEPEALREWIDHFEHYFEATGLRKRADSVVRMDFDEDEDGGEGDEADSEGNVTQFPAA